jgi:hypothetical protein
MKNLKSAFKDDFKRSMAGENHGGTIGGRMAFKNSSGGSVGTAHNDLRQNNSEKTQAQNAVNATRNEEQAQQAAKGD